MTIIGIGGLPAAGKSHLLTTIMATLANIEERVFVPGAFGLAMYEQLGHVYVMGRYTGVNEYPGTDRLSMSCYRHVKMFWRMLAKQQPNAVVIFEGNRLFKDDVIGFAQNLCETLFLVLDAGNETTQRRHTERKDNQTPQILRARETELRNLLAKRPTIKVAPNATPKEAETIVAELLWLITGGA